MRRRWALTRRTLLRWLGAAAVALGAGLLWPGARARANGAARAGLDGLLEEVRGSRAAGLAYLAAHPDENDEAILLEAIFGDVAWPTLSSGELARHVVDRTRSDFQAGDIVNVADWMLGRTEARLFALSSLRR